MLVNIDEIESSGLAKAWEMNGERVDAILLEDKTGYRAQKPVHIEAFFKKVDRRLLLDAHSRADVVCPCSRCLAPVSMCLPVDFSLTLIPADEYDGVPRTNEDSGHTHTGSSFVPQTVDEETYEGKTIDLDPLYREQLLLALPPYPVCREGCKGLCTMCGTNLNDRDCGCDPHVPDPRWAELKKMKLQ